MVGRIVEVFLLDINAVRDPSFSSLASAALIENLFDIHDRPSAEGLVCEDRYVPCPYEGYSAIGESLPNQSHE